MVANLSQVEGQHQAARYAPSRSSPTGGRHGSPGPGSGSYTRRRPYAGPRSCFIINRPERDAYRQLCGFDQAPQRSGAFRKSRSSFRYQADEATSTKETHDMKIAVETVIEAPVADVWAAYTTPEDIKQWNAASNDWHTTQSTVDLRVGG